MLLQVFQTHAETITDPENVISFFFALSHHTK